MRTTIDIPDELFRAAKAKAALEGRLLKDLVLEGLQLVIVAAPEEKRALRKTKFPIIKSSGTGRKITNEMLDRAVEEMDQEIMASVTGNKNTSMTTAIDEYQKLLTTLTSIEGVSASQMFGKPCLKIHGKAFVAQHKETVAFKLTGSHHQQALSIPNAALWDPSGKERPMKEWVALPASASKRFADFAKAAMTYVGASA